jgi:hypothetical protein
VCEEEGVKSGDGLGAEGEEGADVSCSRAAAGERLRALSAGLEGWSAVGGGGGGLGVGGGGRGVAFDGDDSAGATAFVRGFAGGGTVEREVAEEAVLFGKEGRTGERLFASFPAVLLREKSAMLVIFCFVLSIGVGDIGGVAAGSDGSVGRGRVARGWEGETGMDGMKELGGFDVGDRRPEADEDGPEGEETLEISVLQAERKWVGVSGDGEKKPTLSSTSRVW